MVSNVNTKIKQEKFDIINNIKFNPSEDILDLTRILDDVFTLSIDKQYKLSELVNKEFNDIKNKNINPSHLTEIINILSCTKLEEHIVTPPETRDFEIDKKISFNNLEDYKDVIDEYKIHYDVLEQIYSDFEKDGYNKRYSVLSYFCHIYLQKIKNNRKPSLDIFDEIIEDVQNTIINSGNYKIMPNEELILYVNIIVVDAFIRCKIFKNPQEKE